MKYTRRTSAFRANGLVDLVGLQWTLTILEHPLLKTIFALFKNFADTHMVIDETVLEEGQLDNNGKNRIQMEFPSKRRQSF